MKLRLRRSRSRKTPYFRQFKPLLEELERRESPTDLFGVVAGLGAAAIAVVQDPAAVGQPPRGIGDTGTAAPAASPLAPPSLLDPKPAGESASLRGFAGEMSPPSQEEIPAGTPVKSPEAEPPPESPQPLFPDFFVTFDSQPFDNPFADPLGAPPRPDPAAGGGGDAGTPPAGEAGGGGGGGGGGAAADGGGGGGGGAEAPALGAGAGASSPATAATPALPSGQPAGSAAQSAESGAPTTPTAPTPPEPSSARVSDPAAPAPHLGPNFANLPLTFEMNRGQTDSQVQFLARGPGYNLFLTGSDAVLSLAQPKPVGQVSNLSSSARVSDPAAPNLDVLAVSFAGANPNPRVSGLDELPSRSNYFTDAGSFLDVQNFAKVKVENLYQGIDLVYYSNQQGKLEFDFIVAPGANPAAIQMQFQGAQHMNVDPAGNLLLTTRFGWGWRGRGHRHPFRL